MTPMTPSRSRTPSFWSSTTAAPTPANSAPTSTDPHHPAESGRPRPLANTGEFWMIIKRHADNNFGETGVPGIQTTRLWDTPTGDGGYMNRFKAGATFPNHGHEGGW